MSRYRTRKERMELVDSVLMFVLVALAIILGVIFFAVLATVTWTEGLGWLSALIVGLPVVVGGLLLWARAGAPEEVSPYVAEWDWDE